jgi:hypothetical protein
VIPSPTLSCLSAVSAFFTGLYRRRILTSLAGEFSFTSPVLYCPSWQTNPNFTSLAGEYSLHWSCTVLPFLADESSLHFTGRRILTSLVLYCTSLPGRRILTSLHFTGRRILTLLVLYCTALPGSRILTSLVLYCTALPGRQILTSLHCQANAYFTGLHFQ